MAIADLCLDIIITGKVKPIYGQVEQLVEDYSIDVGGSIGIFASQFAKLGGKAGLIGKVGNDIQGKIVRERLVDAGVDISLVDCCPGASTAMGLNLSCEGDRALLTCLGALDLIDKDIFQKSLGVQTVHWHIGSIFLLKKLSRFWIPWIQELKKENITISLDTNWDPDEKWDPVISMLPFVDVFLPNESEALAITGLADMMQAGKELVKCCPLVIIKCGEKGACIFTASDVVEFPIPKNLVQDLIILDTTGAGDNFDAGFLFHWTKGNELSVCIEQAFRCAISSLKGLGGIRMQVNHKETAND